mmetsp:Transcript_34128/g.98401  ORF Transcript_34128/g.98401 Transcript_34128/m.98401 type:complete len:887 (+) Transcript_34128:151-2811(+)
MGCAHGSATTVAATQPEEPHQQASMAQRFALSGASADWHPIMQCGPRSFQCIGLVKASGLKEMSAPWPRNQDVPQEWFLMPKPRDLVVAVSHGWPYQAHPDPFGVKKSQVLELLEKATKAHNPPGDTAAFFDFCSVTQRPWRSGQPDRTPEQVELFGEALRAMPKIYLLADAVLHIDDDESLEVLSVPGDGEVAEVRAAELESTQFVQFGDSIQVLQPGNSRVHQFDFVEKFDGKLVAGNMSAMDLQLSIADPARSRCKVLLRRAPMGLRNRTKCGDRGWVYLERFVSMVKGAMVSDSHFEQTCFSTSPKVVEEIREGARTLRKAAQAGEDMLEEVLERFFNELDRKTFSAASTDKATNTGGVGGETKKKSKQQRDSIVDTKSNANRRTNDRDVVAMIMREMVEFLPEQWAAEAKRQRERQLLLAVMRGNADEVRSMLSTEVDANFVGEGGRTCLHEAAKFRHLEVVRALVASGGDLSIQDLQGNTPAHSLVLYATPETVELFQVLAPTREILGKVSASGVSVVRRFETWAKTADNLSPYAPAESYLAQLMKEFPDLFTNQAEQKAQAFAEFSCAARDRFAVDVGGKTGKVDVWTWESVDLRPSDVETTHIVMISGKAIPWALAEDALDHVARELCTVFHAKVFVLHYLPDAVQPNTLLMDYQDSLYEAIEALPLNEKFVIVENAHGVAAALLWRLRPRLYCASMINFGFWFSDDFLESEAFSRMAKTCEGMAKLCEARETEKVCKGSVANMVHSGIGQEGLASLASRLEVALRESPDAFWSYSAALRRWFTQNASTLRGSERLDEVPMLFLVSDSAPAASVHESARHAREVAFPRSRVSYIQDSNQWWEAESSVQHARVANSLLKFLSEHIPGGTSNRRMERVCV